MLCPVDTDEAYFEFETDGKKIDLTGDTSRVYQQIQTELTTRMSDLLRREGKGTGDVTSTEIVITLHKKGIPPLEFIDLPGNQSLHLPRSRLIELASLQA